jgi:hypothetical protein
VEAPGIEPGSGSPQLPALPLSYTATTNLIKATGSSERIG